MSNTTKGIMVKKGEVPAQELQQRIIATLGELGGAAHTDEDIVFEGTRFVLPSGSTLAEAIRFMGHKMEQDEEEAHFHRTFRYRPFDGAWCTYNAIKKHFGAVGHRAMTVQTFFGPKKQPPQLITINTGPDTQSQVPWGEFTLPGFKDFRVQVSGVMDAEWGPLSSVQILAPHKYRHQAEGLFMLIEKELRENSLYRGKAIDGSDQPEFLDLTGVDPRRVVYSEAVMTELSAHVWGPIRYEAQHDEVELALKRSVLLHGKYGTGKTLAAYLTAQIATDYGWTFIMARPGKDQLGYVLQTARLYQPAVVFFEDLDTVASGSEERDQITLMLDAFDGIQAKGTRILAILTTNHAEKIHKGMVRPGRLDSVIEIAALDSPGVRKLVEANLPQQMLDENIDWAAVAEAMEGYMPAFVKEAADRTIRYAMARTGGKLAEIRVTTTDLVDAGLGLRSQLALMDGAKDTPNRDRLSDVFESVASKAVAGVVQERLLSEDGQRIAARTNGG